MNKIPKVEIIRKIIHLSSLSYPLLYITFATRKIMLICVGLLLLSLLFIDVTRKKYTKVNEIFCKYLGFTIRKAEHQSFTGSTYFMIGTFFTILLFSQQIAILSLCVLVISDTCASLIGISCGKRKIMKNKTLEGFLAFFISALVISFIGGIYFYMPPTPLMVASLVASSLELFSKKIKIDDNILIPLGYGITATLIMLI